MEIKDLIGKTITAASIEQLAATDDTGFLVLQFSDGSEAVIIAYYDSYTGNSDDEYPTRIGITDTIDMELIDIDD